MHIGYFCMHLEGLSLHSIAWSKFVLLLAFHFHAFSSEALLHMPGKQTMINTSCLCELVDWEAPLHVQLLDNSIHPACFIS